MAGTPEAASGYGHQFRFALGIITRLKLTSPRSRNQRGRGLDVACGDVQTLHAAARHESLYC
jgi:hypothetical protein